MTTDATTTQKPPRITRTDFVPHLRGYVGDHLVVDTSAAVVVSEPRKAVGFFAVPKGDVHQEFLSQASETPRLHPGANQYFDLQTDNDVRPLAAWSYEIDGLAGYLGLRFDAFDKFLEEDEEVHVHPRDSRHRVDAIRSSRRVVVRYQGEILADSHSPVALFEGGLPIRWYLPEADIRLDKLVKVSLHTGCPYKGTASYYSPTDDPDKQIAWYYPQPNDAVAAIAGHVAFFNELVDIEVDGKPQGNPLTQWSYGLRDNVRGGGSGKFQATDSSHDHPNQTQEDTMSATVINLDAIGALSRRHPVPPGEFTYEYSERHVRGLIGDTAVVDSYSPLLVWEPGHAVPGYVYAREDVRADLLRPNTAKINTKHTQVGERYDIEVDGKTYQGAAFTFDVDGLRDRIGFEWSRRDGLPVVEHWYEEDEEVFVHPRDPYKRVDPIKSSRHVEVYLDGIKIADTHNPVLLFETRLPIRYYIPEADYDFTHLTPTELSTRCPYKGLASYWSVTTDKGTYDNIIWSYRDPVKAASNITGLLAPYNELVDIIVDGVALDRPQSEFTEHVKHLVPKAKK
ncbi:MAG: DUF427 domain-containing protein [Propionibacteriaceae bacterium]|jgi:uncharacterized protein (DUF427 family)|nr:DUF427 domain-containing protein [Propionibacteriaceae bacterium]